MTARPPKRLAQLRSVSHALVSTLQKHRSKTSKLLRFGSLHFRDKWGRPCRVTLYGGLYLVNLFKQKVVLQKNDLFATVTLHKILFCRRLADHLHCTNRPFTHVLRTLSNRSKLTPFRKNFLNEISRKSRTALLD